MLGITATSDGYERRTARRLSTWSRDYLREVALADLGCAVLGVFVAAQLRPGRDVTPTYLTLSLALPVFWVTALWLGGAHDVRFIGNGSDEFRKLLNAGVSLTATVAIFSYAINIELSRGFGLVLKDLFDRCAAVAALIMLAPPMAGLAMAIWLYDRGPVFFTQVRVGKGGRAFRIYKFRTMVGPAVTASSTGARTSVLASSSATTSSCRITP